MANSFTYTAWGAPTTATHNSIADLGFRYLYVGEFGVAWDNAFSLGLEHMGARHYSPALGRFLQPDPSAAETNLYAYGENGPVTNVDPTGLYVWYYGRRIGILYRPFVRRAAYYAYSAGRISFSSYYKLYCARSFRYRNRTFGQVQYFASQDWCPGGVVAGAIGLVAAGITDAALGLGTIFAMGAPPAEAIMIPLDIGAFTLTMSLYSITEQSTHNNCDSIRFKWPWE